MHCSVSKVLQINDISQTNLLLSKNTRLMQLISIYFTYSKSLHVSGRTLSTFGALALRQHNHYHTRIFYPLDASSASFNGLIPVADMYSIIFSWWWALSCPKHVETYKWNIYLLAASSWCSYLSLYDARKHKTEKKDSHVFLSSTHLHSHSWPTTIATIFREGNGTLRLSLHCVSSSSINTKKLI